MSIHLPLKYCLWTDQAHASGKTVGCKHRKLHISILCSLKVWWMYMLIISLYNLQFFVWTNKLLDNYSIKVPRIYSKIVHKIHWSDVYHTNGKQKLGRCWRHVCQLFIERSQRTFKGCLQNVPSKCMLHMTLVQSCTYIQKLSTKIRLSHV